MTEASLMMVTYNRLPLTKLTLESLLETTKTDFELVLVDNGSSDDTVNYLEEFCQSNVGKNSFKSYKIQKNEVNKGIARGRNDALKLASCEFLVCIDNDVVLPSNWLSQCIGILKENKQLGMVGVNFEGRNFEIKKVGNYQIDIKRTGNLGTALCVFNRSLHKMLGFFNNSLEYYGHEDADMGHRVRVLGYGMGYLVEPGKHLGEGENDQGEYREFKNKYHKQNLNLFYKNCREYSAGTKSIYIPFS